MTLLIFSAGLIDKEFPGNAVIIFTAGAREGSFEGWSGSAGMK
jgi:hypothetical protein